MKTRTAIWLLIVLTLVSLTALNSGCTFAERVAATTCEEVHAYVMKQCPNIKMEPYK